MRAKLIKENIQFKRGLKPKDAMGLGFDSKIKKFLDWIAGDDQFDKNHEDYTGFINIYIDSFSLPWITNAFKLYVEHWKNYEGYLKKLGLHIENIPDLDETIFYDNN